MFHTDYNPVYIIGPDDRQINPTTISVEQGVVSVVQDTEGTTYSGMDIELLTNRDFIWVPDLELPLCVGDEIYLDNQSRERWTICQGWYEVDGNPAIYGWFLQSVPVGKVRSLYMKDLNGLVFATRRTQFSGIEVIPDVPELVPDIQKIYFNQDASGLIVLTAEGTNIGSDSELSWELFIDNGGGVWKTVGTDLGLNAAWSYLFTESPKVYAQITVSDYVSDMLLVKG